MAVYPNKYNKKTDWQEGDYVTAADMNKIEQGIYDSEVYTDEAIAALVSAKQGTSAPTTSTVGTIGQKYLNTTTKDLYECVGISGSSYTWKQIYKWVAADSKYYLVDADGDPIDVSALEAEIAEVATDVSEIIAPAYDSTKHYNTSILLTYEGKLYEGINDDIPVGTLPTNTTYFKEVSVDDVIKEIEDGTREVATAKQAESIKSDRVIENEDVACPPITFGTTGGDAEIQTGFNKFQYLYGKSKKWNQLNADGSFIRLSASTTITNSNYNHGYIATSTDQYSQVGKTYSFIANHKYLFGFDYSTTGTILNGSEKNQLILMYGTVVRSNFTAVQGRNYVFVLPTITGSTQIQFQLWINESNCTYTITNVNVFDLTAMYSAGNEPTIEEFKKEYPLAYYDYNQSTILSAKSSELVSVGENQWDEQTELGIVSGENGQDVSSTTRLRSVGYTDVLGDTEYYSTLYPIYIRFYDASKNFIGKADITTASQQAFTTPSGCKYLRFCLDTSYGTTYNHDISIYICWDTPGRPYVANRTDRVTLPNIELRSVGSGANEVRDEAYQEGGGKRYVGAKFLKTLTWVYSSGYSSFYAVISDIKPFTNAYNALPSTKMIATRDITSMENRKDGGIYAWASGGTTYIFMYVPSAGTDVNAFLATLRNEDALEYELATPTDIPTSENPGWTELVYTDNYGTLQFLTNPAQIPQVPQPYYIEYTVSLVDYLDAAYAHTDGDATKIALKQDVEDIVNGNTPAGKALLADNLESNNKIEDLLPYTMRQAPSGVGKSMLLDHLTGATVAWNQLVKNGDFAGTTNWITYGVSYTVSGNVATIVGNTSGCNLYQNNSTHYVVGHKYLVTVTYKSDGTAKPYLSCEHGLRWSNITTATTSTSWKTATIILDASSSYTGETLIQFGVASVVAGTYYVKNFMMFDLTQMFGSTIANFLYNQGTAGVNKFRTLFPNPYYPYNVGELVGVKTAGRKAVGINQWDEQWEIGAYSRADGSKIVDNTVIRCVNKIPVIPNTAYYFTAPNDGEFFFYDNKEQFIDVYPSNGHNYIINVPANASYIAFRMAMGYGTTYHNNICLNISDSSINGTFYPYEANEYPCEEVELNGLYKLDSNNNIVANGDTYANDGKVTRKYASYTFTGTETIQAMGSNKFKVSGISPALKVVPKFAGEYAYTIIPNYLSVTASEFDTGFASNMDMVVRGTDDVGASYVIFRNISANNNVDTFKATIVGKTMVYERATSEEEMVSSFASTQATGVTEQFMEPETPSTVFLPVGHDSFYLPDLKEKLEDAPDSPTTDGTYLVSRSGGTNVYIPIANVTATQAEIDEIIALLE